jgi:hypothetical protein
MENEGGFMTWDRMVQVRLLEYVDKRPMDIGVKRDETRVLRQPGG